MRGKWYFTRGLSLKYVMWIPMPCVCRDGGVYLFGQKYGVGRPMRTLGESGKVRKMVNQKIPQLESLVIHSTKTYTIEIPGCFMAFRWRATAVSIYRHMSDPWNTHEYFVSIKLGHVHGPHSVSLPWLCE